MSTWISRALIELPHVGLCTTEKRFKRELAKLDLPREQWPDFMPREASACVHFLEYHGKPCMIVCISGWQGRDPVQVAGMLVHEAAHVWQETRRQMNEKFPSDEFEAYSLQHIAQCLMTAFQQQTMENA
jgi:hypothetical protein